MCSCLMYQLSDPCNRFNISLKPKFKLGVVFGSKSMSPPCVCTGQWCPFLILGFIKIFPINVWSLIKIEMSIVSEESHWQILWRTHGQWHMEPWTHGWAKNNMFPQHSGRRHDKATVLINKSKTYSNIFIQHAHEKCNSVKIQVVYIFLANQHNVK